MVPEQSAGGSLTERPPPPRVERSAPEAPGAPPSDGAPLRADDPSRRISATVDGWRRALAGSGLPDTLLASGPQATADPFNKKFVTRHYGFGGAQGTGSVTIAGRNQRLWTLH